MSGGAAACVTVGRLIARNPFLKILVVESGKHSRDVPNQVEPCRFVEHLADNSTTITRHKSKPSSFLDGRSAIVQSGHTVGGGSAVNCKQPTPMFASHLNYFTFLYTVMVYVRGAKSDYDGWAGLGNNGWSFNELLPLIKRVNTSMSLTCVIAK